MKTIKKSKLNSVGYLEVEFEQKVVSEENETFTIEAAQKCTWSPHNDLLVKLDALKPHLAVLCEQVENMLEITSYEVSFEAPHPILAKLKVTGFTIGGSDEHEGVTLIGRRVLAGNRVLNLVSPFAKWEDEHNGYEHSYELAVLINDLQGEVRLYLEGKKAPAVQLSLEFENNEQ
ncbi:MAG: hypothetical protein IM569_13730 [Chitinophagaceae bacterium]|nr:hypothetical protein [Chitinophagaceae bacterium]